jgi:hypothetical protein
MKISDDTLWLEVPLEQAVKAKVDASTARLEKLIIATPSDTETFVDILQA